MKYNMTKWLNDIISSPIKKAFPILSFPALDFMDIKVSDLVSSGEYQTKAMEIIAEKTDSYAAVSLMDLSVEAECFGATVHFSDDEVPTITGHLIETEEDAEKLQVPPIGSGRTGECLKGIKLAVEKICDRPVFAGVIGPYSLAGRLLGVTEIMMDCYDEPEKVETVLEKCTAFLINYCKAFKETGANGVIMAEPLTGLLSPSLAEEFSTPYVKKIIDEIQDDNFAVIYHNCGDRTISIIDSVLKTGASCYHFGNAINMADMLSHIPSDVIAMGNIDPAGELKNGDCDLVKSETKKLLEECSKYNNFVISSGCDIPPKTPWENINAFFETVKNFYGE
ncbi:MAG: uroporphyrinogen decarboxylase family protein [Clostridia bacterium]|nr:uroporphyrinogen decarboxylase family protein [Clostridia bacterium]